MRFPWPMALALLLFVAAPAHGKDMLLGCVLRLRALAGKLTYDAETTRKRLVDLHYAPDVARRLADEYPRLALEISLRRSPAVTVYRGRQEGFDAYDPYEPQVPGVKRASNSVGKGDEMWVTNDVTLALGYTSENGYASGKSEGVIIEYQIPEFMLRDTAGWRKTGATQVDVQWMGSGEAPFVVRIAKMNGRTVPSDPKGVDVSRFVKEWVSLKPRAIPKTPDLLPADYIFP